MEELTYQVGDNNFPHRVVSGSAVEGAAAGNHCNAGVRGGLQHRDPLRVIPAVAALLRDLVYVLLCAVGDNNPAGAS